MSKFLGKLEKISRGVTTPLGFGNAARPEKVASMALVGMISGTKKATEKAALLAKIGADGALIDGIDIDEVPDDFTKALDKVPWGIRMQGLEAKHATTCKEKGCDFLAFEPDKAALTALEDEDTGYVLCIEPDMDEKFLRAIEDLPIDVVLLSAKAMEPPLTVQDLITISSVRGAFSKYLLLDVPGDLSTGELEGLRNIGVDGLVVNASSLSAKALEELRDRLLALPKKARNRSTKPDAVLPRGAYGFQSASPAEEEEDDDY